MTFYEERRADQAAKAEQKRLDARHDEQLRADRQREADERKARLQDQARADRQADRLDRQQRRRERAERRREVLTPAEIYRRGTLAVVTASGLASLPAQILHFVGISPMLLPLPLAIEGLAWVMAAGVAYADARHLPAWVRWLLRSLIAGFAGFAAFINYGYGLSLVHHGLSADDAQTVGRGLAAVTLLGPIAFEIRQWVSTLAASIEGADADRREHARRRRRHHRKVVRIADRLISAAPFGTLDRQTAFERAWSIVRGCPEPGMTPKLYERAAKSAQAMHKARAEQPDRSPAEAAPKGPDGSAEQSMADLDKSTPAPIDPSGLPEPVTEPLPDRPKVDLAKHTGAPAALVESIRSAPIEAARTAAAEAPRPRRVTGKVPAAARSKQPRRTPEQLLDEARSATADWPIEKLSAEAIRKAVRTGPDKARDLRDTLRAERADQVDPNREEEVAA
ncbi:hypothetical protein [Streptomyces noursei]|uniref:hypothetical protein n=1 Tax=Streptomyces noursei TaxID=1971 RepID=UPI0019649DFC|nr:hypothetical protein [Streptomyces noursei]QRX92040.1 hypothetical protein JNO44_15295 [Streptomyces noursei]